MTTTHTCAGIAFVTQEGESLYRIQRAYAITLLDLDGDLVEHFNHYDMELRTTAEDFWNAHFPSQSHPWSCLVEP